jgi:ABC-type sugar transport system permease subunit
VTATASTRRLFWTGSPAVTGPPNRPGLLWLSVALLGAAVLVSIAALALLGRGGEPLRALDPVAQGAVRSARLDSQTIVTATVDNTLTTWQGARKTGEIPLPALASAMASVPDGKVAVGMVTGQVQVFDTHLQPGTSFKVQGRVTGLAAGPDGALVLTYGSGPAASDFQVNRYDRSGAPVSATEVGFATRGVAFLHDLAVYSNARGEVGALDSAGQVVWTTLAQQVPTSIAAAPKGDSVYVGDIRGGVTRLSATGDTEWRQATREYPIETLYPLDSGAIVAGAQDGSVIVFDPTGVILFDQRLVDSPISGLVDGDGGSVEAISASGSRFAVNVAAIGAAGPTQRLRLGWYAVDGLLALASLVLAAAGFGRSRVAIVRAITQAYRVRVAYLLIAPSVLLIAVFVYYPAAMALYVSFTDFSLRGPAEFVGLRNFDLMRTDPFLLPGIKNMVLLLLTSVLKHVTVPLLVAELIFWFGSERVRYWFRTAFVVPAVVPGIVAVLLWKMIWAPNIGLVNQTLMAVGLGQFQHTWLGEESTALLAIILTGFPWVAIFAFLVYFGGLLAVSSEMFEAAAVDGASPLRRFWSIDLAMLAPQIRLVLFFTFIESIQGFAGILVLTNGGPGTATYVPALEMYMMISRASEFGYASAIGFTLAALVGVVVFLRLRFDPQQQER